MNKLFYGDNLSILREHVDNESVDLIYLDPPFKSNQDYNVLFKEKDGSKAAAQILAFEDTWEWNMVAAESYKKTVELGGPVSEVMQAFWTFLGGNDMMAYLAMMAPRLVELRRVLKTTGSIYLHCDVTASAYLRLLMDAIFKPQNFRNEIVWWYRKWSASESRFLRNHDTIFFYSASQSQDRAFNVQYVPLADSTLKRFGGKRQEFADDDRTRKVTGEEESKGSYMPDVWPINLIPANSAERLGYPTQKPIALLERIVRASSNEGEVVLDPFCGCGTSIAAAEELDRDWIGIDITHIAIGLIKHRLLNAYGKEVKYEVIGEPVSLPDAERLAHESPYQFQWWAAGLVGGRLGENKKGADLGIDGRLYFHDDLKPGNTKEIVISVKAGHIPSAHIREIRGVVDREDAAIGVLLTMEHPTKPMKVEAAKAGFYDSPMGSQHPKIQILTIEDLLDGKGIDYPLARVNATFRKARRVKKVTEHPQALPFE